ncbi:MAG: hypothetical protein JNN07_23670 [Verrucomicrobiales bacterium]|nr:hypothetical protein [Verrucomicrobiales bacterium]
MTPLSFLLVGFAGWMNRRQQAVIECLQRPSTSSPLRCGLPRGWFVTASLREAVSQFVEHYHQERNHQALDNQIIRPEFAEFPAQGSVHHRQRLGELLHYYSTTVKPQESALV